MVAGLIAALAMTGYWQATRRVARAWPPLRTACFVAGCALIALAAIGLPDEDDFVTHVAQHLLLGMVAPALLTLGAPVTLLIKASSAGPRRRLVAALHSPVLAAATHPILAWALFGGSLFALYLTPVYRLSLEHRWLHEALHAHFLLVGALFFWTVVGLDPAPRRLPHGARMLMVLLTVPFHAVLGVALLGASAPMAGVASLGDQRAGASLLWAGGDVLGLLTVLVVAAQWAGHDEREAVRADRRADTVHRAASARAAASREDNTS